MSNITVLQAENSNYWLLDRELDPHEIDADDERRGAICLVCARNASRTTGGGDSIWSTLLELLLLELSLLELSQLGSGGSTSPDERHDELRGYPPLHRELGQIGQASITS